MSDAWLSPTNNSNKRSIREVQMALGLHADGQYSRGLVATVSDFQATNGLVADGMVGPATWGALLGMPEEKPKKASTKKEAEPKEAEAKAPAKKKAPVKKKAAAK